MICQYTDFSDNIAVVDSEFGNFNKTSSRVNELFHKFMSRSGTYSELWSVVKRILLTSHGQTTVEHGFSVNKQIEFDNMIGDTFVANRMVLDHLRAVGSIDNLDVNNKQLLLSCCQARLKYLAHLEDQKKANNKSEMKQSEKLFLMKFLP